MRLIDCYRDLLKLYNFMNLRLDKLQVFDSHCHPQFPQYDQDREKMLARAFGAGVSMVCVGTDLEMSRKAVELAAKYEKIRASVGLHPNDFGELFEADKISPEKTDAFLHLANHERVVAMGEMGLDYYRTPDKEHQKKQKEIFEFFINLAYQSKKPLIIHGRDSQTGSSGRAHGDIIEILNFAKNIIYGGVAHSFTGSIDEAKRYLDLGFCLGFNGIITFARQYDEVVKYVPLENILIETDAPYLTPEPYRNQRNEPIYVIEVAKKIATLKNISIDEVIEKTTKNCKNLFNIYEI